MKAAWILAGVTLPVAIAAIALAWPADEPATAAIEAAPTPAPRVSPPATPIATAPSPGGPAASSKSATPSPDANASTTGAPAIAPVPPARAQVADSRVPPIDPPEAEAPGAQPWEVADPALYQARERRQAQEVADRFVQAAQQRLPQMRAALAQMQARGASPADIARAQDKIRHLEAVQDSLLRGEAASMPR